MKKLIAFFLLVVPLVNSAQEKETITQNRADHVGIKTKKDFKAEPHIKWFDESYHAYLLDERTIKKLKKNKEGIKIKVFMSVWCHDSHREVPQLYKILEAIDFDENDLEVVALNRSKKAPGNPQEGYNIKRTPTLIFYKDDQEIARYVEKPRYSLEKDMLRIFSGKSYKHSYDTNLTLKH